MSDGKNEIKVDILPNGVKRTTIVNKGNTTKVDMMPDGRRQITRPNGHTHALPPLQPSVVIIPERK